MVMPHEACEPRLHSEKINPKGVRIFSCTCCIKKKFKGRGYRKSGRFFFTHVFLRMHLSK